MRHQTSRSVSSLYLFLFPLGILPRGKRKRTERHLCTTWYSPSMESIRVTSVAPTDKDALDLEAAMQAEYVEMYGEPDQDPDNHISTGLEVLLMTDAEVPAALAVWGVWPDGDGKLKAIYVEPEHRGSGLGRHLLRVVEHRMRAEGLTRVRFETGPKQDPAVSLYRSEGYRGSDPFGFYENNEGSYFFVKELL